ncbi:hypothetical protein TNCV_1544391 [Trichonephila clavipes]|nr:hypothetical protein TNCV_1544391 [Trichonephila clavipes]
MIPLEQFGLVEQSSDLASHSCILAFQSVHFVDKFLTATIAASTFAQLCLYVAGDDLLLGMTAQLHALRQCDCVRSQSFAHKVFENGVIVSFFFIRNRNGDNEKGYIFHLYYRFYILYFAICSAEMRSTTTIHVH